MLLKLSKVTQYWEVKFSQLLPKITAKTHWQERVQIRLHQVDGEVVHSHNMFMSCQDKVLLASELLGARGASFAFHFLAYVGCLLTYVTSLNITAKDTGVSNIGVSLSTASASCPEAVFFDTLSWRQGPKVSSKWVGWCDCARRFCPFSPAGCRKPVLPACFKSAKPIPLGCRLKECWWTEVWPRVYCRPGRREVSFSLRMQ